MTWYLENVGVPPRRLELKPAVTVTVGQALGVTQSFPGDSQMSPVHFALSLASGAVRLQNLSKTIGTAVNGQIVEEALLQAGDWIKAGETVFVLHAPEPSPYPAPLRIGGWGFETIPEGWKQDEGLGFHFSDPKSFKANITAMEEPLPSAQTLAPYVQTQVELAVGRIAGISVENPVPLNVPGADEALMLVINIPQASGLQVLQRQVYALSSGIVGIFTATVSASEPHKDTLDAVIEGLSYFQG